jgi:acetoin utilization deacetylase AcuC-like enzyme
MRTVYYSPAYTASGYTFDTSRKAGWVADSLLAHPIAGLQLRSPPDLPRSLLEQVHDPAYVRAVEIGQPVALAESQGFRWDAGLWRMVLASNGGAVAAALTALEQRVAGSLSSGLHHARRETGTGFCTFNGLALAAQAALDAGAGSVLILDLDAHCGGGTHSLIAGDERIWQVDVAVNSFDSYQPTERTSLDLVRGADDYLPTIERRLAGLDQAPRFDLCLYNAGMDPYERCDLGGLAGITLEHLAAREAMVFDWCARRGVAVAFVLAGGYLGDELDQAGLVEAHRLTLTAAAAVSSRE